MLSEYPYGTIKVTGILHGLIATGTIIANGYTLYKIHSTIQKVTTIFGLDLFGNLSSGSSAANLSFGILIGIGIYFLFVGAIGEMAGSKRKNKRLVYSCKITFLVVNILSTFFYCWIYGVAAYLMVYLQDQFFDPFNVEVSLKANFGLIIAEFLVSIFSIILCCISGEPVEVTAPDQMGLTLAHSHPGPVNVNMYTPTPLQMAQSHVQNQAYNPQYPINQGPEFGKF